MVACPTRSTFHILYHKFAVSRRYSQDPTEIQYNYSHYCTCIIMRIPPTTFMQLLRSLEIPMAQVIDALVLDPFPIFEGGVRQRQTKETGKETGALVSRSCSLLSSRSSLFHEALLAISLCAAAEAAVTTLPIVFDHIPS